MALVDFAAWCCASEGNKPKTISGKLSAVQYFHTVEVGVHLPTKSPLIRRQLQGIKLAHLAAGSEKRLRLPVGLHELLGASGRRSVERTNGGRVLYRCLLLCYFVGARAHEIFQSDRGVVHPIHCLTRIDIAFFDGGRQLEQAEWRRATRTEIRFRGHKGDQDQLGVILVRTRDTALGPRSRLDAEGGAVAALVELMSYDLTLSEHAPLSAFRVGEAVKVWNYRQASRALRLIASQAGLDPQRVSLHSLRIGTATVLAAGGDIAERVIQREGRGKSGIDTYKVYTRNNWVDSAAVSGKLTAARKRPQTQPGQGTRWGCTQ